MRQAESEPESEAQSGEERRTTATDPGMITALCCTTAEAMVETTAGTTETSTSQDETTALENTTPGTRTGPGPQTPTVGYAHRDRATPGSIRCNVAHPLERDSSMTD